MEDQDHIARLYLRQRDRLIKELVRRLGIQLLPVIETAVRQADILRDFETVVEDLYVQLVTEGGVMAERSVPMSLKEDVYDEWAAVARHQDEVQRMSDYERAICQKEQQQRYKMELDALIRYKHTNATDEAHRYDRKLVKELVERDLKLATEHKRNEQSKKAIAQQFESEGLDYAAYKQTLLRTQRMEEQAKYSEALQREQEAQAERDRYAAELRRRNMESVNRFNDKQQYYKQRDTQIKRIEDLDSVKTEFGHRNTEELRRQKIMQDYASSCNRTPLTFNSKVEAYKQKVKNASNEKWLLDSRSDQRQLAQSEMQATLARQSIEREYAKAAALTEKQQIAAEMAEQLRKIREEDEAGRTYKRAMQRNYSSLLDLQSNDSKRVRQMDCMMTDHERRINQDDIYNYVTRSPRLDSKVPGLLSPSSYSDRGSNLSTTPRSHSDTVFTRHASSILSGR